MRVPIGFEVHFPNSLTRSDWGVIRRLERERKLSEQCPDPNFWSFIIFDPSVTDAIPHDDNIVMRFDTQGAQT